MTATAFGVSEKLVLKSLAAPTEWTFPLRLKGLTPMLKGGGVELRDASGKARAAIPPGFMYDSTPDPKTGTGTRSNGVMYALIRDGDAWALRMTLDGDWLGSSARLFPVVVDPPITVRDDTYIDSFVSSSAFANRDNSAEPFLKVGTHNGGGEKSAAYVRFYDTEAMFNKYVIAAELNVHQTWARSCTPSKLTVYRVTESWWNQDVFRWPGPAYDSANPVASKSFSRGGNCTSPGAYWEPITLPDEDRVTRWLNGSERWDGFTLRASNTDNNAEKFFHSSEVPGGAPYLDLMYADEGAKYSLPSNRFDPPATPSTMGFLDVDVTNLGTTTWLDHIDAPSFTLIGYFRNSSGQLVYTSYFGIGDVPVPNRATVRLAVYANNLPAGTYTVTITMQDAQERDFHTYYGVPPAVVSFTVLPDATPEVVSFHPPNNARVDRLRPALWAQYFDADNAPGTPSYWFRVCNGTEAAPVGCQESQWITSATWTVPAGVLSWGKTSFWYVAVYDGQNMSHLTGPYYMTPVPAQPEITHHLAGALDTADVPGLNVQVGNYSTEAVDASVTVPGPQLRVSRTYNSQDPRASGAFGVGWSTPWDQRLTVDPDGNVVVTLASGRQVRFGRNTDGSFAPPPGEALTLVRGTSSWTLRDSSERRDFDDGGKLATVTDAYGRQQQYIYTSGVLSQVKDVVSGRSLYPTWTSGRVTAVKADAPVAGGAQPTWTYTYTGNQLRSVCSPLSSQSCVSYEYTTGSHYRSIVTDDNPTAYWPLGEASGGTAANVVARKPGEHAANFRSVTLGQAGALAGTTDTAATFGGAGNGGLTLPTNLTNTTLSLSVEMWFKAATGQRGVLYSHQNTAVTSEPVRYSPSLYIDTTGKLRGYHWTPSGMGSQMVSAGRVDNGQWHHVVLTGSVTSQELYLDGVRIGAVTTAQPISFLDMRNAYIGNGRTTGWPAAVDGNFPFNGQIDDVAFYKHSLAATQVSAHYAARNATSRMAKTIEPGSFTSMQATYDGASGRVATMQDRHGAAWTVTQPAVGDGVRTVAVSTSGREPVSYTFDALRGGRLVSRSTESGTEKWDYDANGFVNSHIDANGRTRFFYRDDRGNLAWEVTYRGGWVFKGYGYYYNSADKLDPRNDRLVSRSGTRNASDGDGNLWIFYGLDTTGRPTTVSYPAPAGASSRPTESFIYTAGTEAAIGGGVIPAGLLRQVTNRLGGATTYGYNSRGDLVRATDPAGLVTEYGYDLLGRNTSRTTKAVVNGQNVTYGTWSIEYNAASLVTVETEPAVTNSVSGAVHTARTAYTYDDSGRVTEKTVSDTTGGDPARTWISGFDGAGRLIRSVTPDGAVTTQTWDSTGDLISVTKPNGLTIAYQYDDAGKVIQTVAGGVNVDPFDRNARRLVLESRAYDPAGQLASVVDAMGRETTYTYYNDGLIETEKRVRRDSTGEVTSSVELARYEYDYANNLTRVTEAGGVVRDYDYDDAGNRSRETLDAGSLGRLSLHTFTPDGQVASTKQTNGFTFLPGRAAEAPHMYAAGTSYVDEVGNRHADGSAAFTYKLSLPADTTQAVVHMDIENQYLVRAGPTPTPQTMRDVAIETRDIQDGSNRTQKVVDVTSWLGQAKIVYLRFGDSQPANAWGASLARLTVEYTRANGTAASTTHGYDLNGRLTNTTVDNRGGTPTALATTVNRDPRGLAISVTDPAGAVTTNTYDAVGRPSTVTQPARTIWDNGVRTDNVAPRATLGYNTFGDSTHIRDAAFGVTTTGYDAMGRATSVTLPPYTPPGGTAITSVSRATYTTDGQPETTTDPLGRVTTYGYDLYGHLKSKTLPPPDGSSSGGPRWSYEYDRAGQLLLTRDPAGATTSATYNDLGHQITETVSERDATGTVYYTSTLGRDDAGNLTSRTTPLNHTASIEYNKAGEVTKGTDPSGRTAETRYNAQGRVTAEFLAGALATSYSYDTAGRRVQEADHTVSGGVLSAPVRTTTTTYDALDRPTQVTSGEGRITRHTYDAGGNRTAITQLLNPSDTNSAITVTLGYDASGRHTRTVDGRGKATDVAYNAWNLPTTVREPGPATWTTVYDAAGRPIREEAPGGVTRTREYDEHGQVTTETGTGAGGATLGRSFRYDGLGRITRVGGPQVTDYTWNDRGLLTRSSGPGGVAEFGYDAEGNLTSRTDAAGTGTFTYDAAGRVQTVTDALTAATATLSYAATGELAGVSHGAARPSRTLTYDNLGRLASDTSTRSDGVTALSTTYTYDRDDLITGKTTAGFTGAGTNAYGYDGLGRLTSWTRPDTTVVSYGYDAASNRTSLASAGGTRTYTYDDRNRLLTASGGGQPAIVNTWSARGTLDVSTVDGVATTFHNDAFDKPVQVEGPGHTTSYAYDSLDRLVQRNGATLAYPDLTNNPAKVPTATGDALVFRDPNGIPMSDKHGTSVSRQVVTDRLHGDMVGALDGTSGAVAASRSYAPYGEVAAGTGAFSLGYQGGFTEPNTGLVNAHARWYDPGQATFTSRDSWTIEPDPVAAANRYAYGNASPVTYSDPTGHVAIALGLGIAASVAWGVTFATVTLLAGAYVYDAYQGSCYASGSGCGYGRSDPYMSPELGQVRALVSAIGSTELYAEIYRRAAAGASAQALAAHIQATYGWHPAVQQYTAASAAAGAASAAAAGATAAAPSGAVTIWRPPAVAPRPPIGQTLNSSRPPITYLLPAGEQARNTVATSIALAIPTILQANADGGDAANQAIGPSAAAGAVAEFAGTGDPSGDDDEFCGPTYRDLAGQGLGDSHHIYQHAAMRDLPGVTHGDSPAIALQGPSTKRGTPHYHATQVQRQHGGGTLGAETQIALQALVAAGLDPQTALEKVYEARKYFYGLGMCDDTPTRIPGNRKKGP
ncbi:DNRLRE domain-containing protein [Micromonospora sp. CPCC 205371]|nr:DNRLRE domain-containing protein [Micromonospora sp. CPCC 205371]